MTTSFDFTVPRLGECTIASPVQFSRRPGDSIADYVSDDQFIVYDLSAKPDTVYRYTRSQLLELAGPRERIYFDPAAVRAGVVTCGGLCPGLNGVIRAVVMCLWYRYGVRAITGIRFGYLGLLPQMRLPVMELTPEIVADIHLTGGTILGSARGGGNDVPALVDAIQRLNLSMLFTIGGDGTQKGALAIAEEIARRGLRIAVVGIPKTIDNDLSFIQRSFGFETAVSKAVEAVVGAHTEAHDAVDGIGIVKVMGRQSGFIAAHTALACSDVNFVLVPEVPFQLEGPNGLLAHLKRRMVSRRHAVVLVAEGAGQDLFEHSEITDASGNPRLGDIGILLKNRIAAFFREQDMEVNIRYFDPGYMIRSAPANPNDSVYCSRLGTNAAHAAMAGRTQALISLVSETFVHVPMRMAVSRRNFVDPEGALWRDVLEATGQPALMTN